MKMSVSLRTRFVTTTERVRTESTRTRARVCPDTEEIPVSVSPVQIF